MSGDELRAELERMRVRWDAYDLEAVEIDREIAGALGVDHKTVGKDTHNRWEPWLIVLSAFVIGGTVGGVIIGGMAALLPRCS